MRVHGYRFFFYSNEGSEPPHVHVEHSGMTAKFWLSPVKLATRSAFGERESRRLERVIERDEVRILEAWHEYFDR
ncbi:DUF4160 domain-containing protein [Microbacterium sp. WCS2018Hpa-9]|uniref:DUF4160 domain-containing protein n=1 Tax=Microbacterium sp. WCS2018Hpa-9 TaxID=3073635 RepID=UPI00288ADF0D|nr:DUF4160 domain-containing protein [Microbacterium sp. WCS2018Hpa-9]